MLKISELDSRILKYLLQDGRDSFAGIAQKCGVTKNKVWKRYKAMERKGIISGATLQVNFANLGYDAVATLLVSVEAHEIDRVIERIGKIREVRAYRHYNSAYNVRGVTILKDISELDHVKETLRRSLPIMGLKTYVWTGVRNIPQNLKLAPNEKITLRKHEPALETTLKQTIENEVDELDWEIINRLASEGRVPFSEIACEIGTSTDTVVKRYHRLKEKGVIKVSIQVNLNLLGYHALLDFNIASVSSLILSGIIESLANIPDIVVVTKTSGDYDLQVTAVARDIKEMFTLQEEIAKILGITKIETSARKIPDAWPTPLQHISTY
jgi:DNA-binding Lrp family transcriptional regulator